MSEVAEPGLAPKPQGHGGGHGEHPHGAQGTFRSYMTGFVLSVILTAIPFWLVMGDVLNDTLMTSIVIMALAAVQIVVHMIYFLHMNTKSEGGWTFLALLFTLTLVVITLVGSIWVMYHMDQNMMPMSPHEALQKP
ncbi:cytochrome o ubiquinol oxidase subunit IV [Microvirga sp. 3-52]|jgi:cytochrome o ubiquinol oxidase subunit IV|uniref:cytochrome o ubiquinol oxidase subunit IV n=1 Tax=Microvirga sp. 3-52 TaxID=2792425 RepID=UPI001ACEDA54|nr:cytochrome o ubiquinol oxidase subunit IV [Microvirga sp. 3-52]MBO1907373.1 cytochrome o ubiquinol oxidase subunit IV [Microvirga sp. 3-52]MBS7454270.1 cytochrome o ubiquinol oxidase subunit IV [Microvirga sp. 3-52]